MNNTTKKAGYLKGLLDSMTLDESKTSDKLLKGIVELLHCADQDLPKLIEYLCLPVFTLTVQLIGNIRQLLCHMKLFEEIIKGPDLSGNRPGITESVPQADKGRNDLITQTI